jgi:restriction system protein
MARRRRKTLGSILKMYLGGFAAILAVGILSNPTVRVLLILGVFGGVVSYVGRRIYRQQQRLRARRLEAIRTSEYQRLWAIRAQAADGYQSMSGDEFEHALVFLCKRDGCLDARKVGGAGDLGADVIATLPDGRRLVIQAKRYAPGNMVTSPHLQRFGGTCFAVHQANVAVVVTTSAFTKQAQGYAAKMRIRLFGQQELGAWASGTGPPPWLI